MAPSFLRGILPPLLALAAVLNLALAQRSQAQTLEQSAAYVSQADADLTIRRVTVLPVVDNVDGIYARQIETQLTTLTRASHRWDYVDANVAGAIPTASELEEAPAEFQRVARDIDADAFIVAAASRGPNGLSLKLDLFLKKDGKLLAQEILKDHPRYSIPELREQVKILYNKLVAKIPYQGLLLSRQQNRVTINLGKSDGIVNDQILAAVQIISVNRHPKFNFLISTEKEILGRIKILKVDETLSFGAIIAEKEKGAIQRMAKIAGLNEVTYPVESLNAESGSTDLAARADSKVSFGKDPKEWLPVRPPSFGQVGIKLAGGSYTSSVKLDGVGALDAKSDFYPSISIHGELWLDPNWTVRTDLAQGIISTGNPRQDSSPNTLSHAMSRYSLSISYNFLLRDDFFGPKLFLSGGIGTYNMFVDDTQPRSLTTVTYSGPIVGLGGSFPVTDDKAWYVGGQFNIWIFPKLTETPVSSGGSAKNTVNDFSLFVEKKIAENLKGVGSLDFSLYSTNFSGAGTRTETATSLSQRHTQLAAGVIYMF